MNNKIVLLSVLTLTIAGCKSDKEEEVAPQPPAQGNLLVTYGFHWEEDEFNLASTYTDGASHAIQFTAVKFFLSETHLQNGGAVLADYHDHYVLATPDDEPTVTYGTVPAGAYDLLAVTIGLDSTKNHSDPSSATPPLDDTSMHWGPGTTNGYYFFVLEGRVDDDGTGIVESDDPVFTYRCATDSALRVAQIPISSSVASGGALFQHVHIRVNEIVAGVNMLTTQAGTGYEPINQQLMDNLAGALDVE